MQDINRDELMSKGGSIYKLVIVAAMRAGELSDGAAKLVDMPADAKFSNIALKEIAEGKISYKIKEKK